MFFFFYFWNTFSVIYKVDSARFLNVPGLAWQTALKKTKVKLDVLTDIDLLLIVEKGIRGGIFHDIYWSVKANTKCIKNMIKIDNYHILSTGM